MDNGYIKLHRKLLENPIVCKDSYHLAIWIHILLSATHKNHDIIFNSERHTLQPGEFSTGRKILAKQFKITESKVERVLKYFVKNKIIEQRTDRQCRIIKVLKWCEYQKSDNEGTTSEQRVNTKQEGKNDKNIISKDIIIYNNENSEFFKIIKQYEKSGKLEQDKINRILELTDSIITGNELLKFWNYWSESDQKGKMRWQKEKTFELKKRLRTWAGNQKTTFTTNKNKVGAIL